MGDLLAARGVHTPGDLARLESDDALRARKLREATGAFEGMFVKMLLEGMRKSTKEGLFGSSFSGEIHESLFDDALSRSLAHSGALGIADMLYAQLAPAAGLAEVTPESASQAYERAGGRDLAPIESSNQQKDGSVQ